MADERRRFEIKLNGGGRDRRIAAWLDQMMSEGKDAGEMVKNILDEIITGKSSITGRPMTYQGDMHDFVPSDPADPVAKALLNFED